MGSVTVGDLIIVTSALTSMPEFSNYLIGKVFEIVSIDTVLEGHPYYITSGDRSFWVEGVPYSPLMLELL